jgi:hypothetical protein
MISAPWVRTRLLELMADRVEFDEVSTLYGWPTSDADLAGTDPDVRLAVMFEAPVGELVVDEMCGPTVQEYRELYTMPIVVQALARNTGASQYDVDDRKATLLWALTRAVQDATLGFVSSDDARFDQIYVVLGGAEGSSGPLETQGSLLAATLTRVELSVEAKIAGEA